MRFEQVIGLQLFPIDQQDLKVTSLCHQVIRKTEHFYPSAFSETIVAR